MEPKKTFYYSDELSDDFAPTNGKISTKKLPDDYRYIHKDPVWQIIAAFLYRLLATPIVFIFMKLAFSLKIKNKRALKKIKGGYFLYGNHTQSAADAFIPTLISFPKKANIITSPDAVSIPVCNVVVPMCGGMPLHQTIRGKVKMLNAMRYKIGKKQTVTIYPEAHIWPYYNKIRPFSAESFAYPYRMNVPAVGFTVTYRPRKVFEKLYPCITVTISDPVYPSECKDFSDMRDKIYNFMVETVEKENSCEYIKYIKRNDENESNDSM